MNNPYHNAPVIHLDKEETDKLISLIKKIPFHMSAVHYANEIYTHFFFHLNLSVKLF